MSGKFKKYAAVKNEKIFLWNMSIDRNIMEAEHTIGNLFAAIESLDNMLHRNSEKNMTKEYSNFLELRRKLSQKTHEIYKNFGEKMKDFYAQNLYLERPVYNGEEPEDSGDWEDNSDDVDAHTREIWPADYHKFDPRYNQH